MSWELLAELARREQEIVEAGRWEELLALQSERDAVIATLDGPPPPELRTLLEEARERSIETEAALGWALADTGRQLSSLRHGRRAVIGYGPGAGAGFDARA